MTRVLAPRSVHDTTLWAIHPGGRAILDVVQEKLDLSDTDLAPSREVLRRYGNMSSATVMFVLRSMLHEAKHEGYGLAMAFGPGLTLETMRFTKARG
jgi:predicted naringenin-chalcone synthase